jgi:26S proteasome regulatory subunit N13
MVTPDLRKGKILLVKESDNLLHFKWDNRVNNQTEDDRIIFPGDALFKKVKTGRENDRVYLLTFHSQKFMFWMQDLDASKDAENVTKMNDLMNNPRPATASTGGPNDFARMMG